MAAPEKPRQIALDLGHAVGLSRDDLLVTPANVEAVTTVDCWPRWTSPFLVVTGPSGSGKTHLAYAWRERVGAIALTRDHIGRGDLGGRLPPVLIDDADGPGLDEAGLFHLLNSARELRSTVLMTARQPSSAWTVRLPDLASRLKLAAVAALNEPDEALLAGVMTKLFADRQVEIEPHVVQFAVRRMERSLAAVARAVEAMDRAAMERKSRITRMLAANVLDGADSRNSADE